jgi:Trehalose and maltose hydrolases (possible phosphorylases)
MYVKTNADVKLENNYLRFQLHEGKNEILISVNEPIRISNAQSLDETIQWWHDKWLNTGFLMIPDPQAQNMWVRSMAMFLASYNADGAGLSPPCGYTGNGWPFAFPQDISYVHPMLLATGNIDIAKSWIEHFSSGLDGMKEYTKRLTGANGILSPWVFPYNDFNGYHNPAPPNMYYYQIHNSGYLARMANETAIFVNDDDWTKKFAIPLIRETAEFYKSISEKEKDGLWHLFLIPSMGQDEGGGINQKDYLCALYSAKYCFQLAIEYGLDTDGGFRQVLDRLAFQNLLSPRGFYYTCLGSGSTDFGKQKHPIQLNAWAYLPVDSKMSEPSRNAYDLRYEITADANKLTFHGWTLGTFLLAGSRYGNTREWLKDWDNLRKSDYVDAEWIQIYESSRSYGASFYNTTNGLVAQSLLNNLICDWYGNLEIAKCNPWQGDIYLNNIYSKLGVVVDGLINGRSAQLRLKAWKDTEFELNGEIIKLKKGETIKKEINQSP